MKVDAYIPEDIHFIAQDADGKWWGYRHEPEPASDDRWTAPGYSCHLAASTPSPNWCEELYAVSGPGYMSFDLTLPNWANYLAQDLDGEWWIYEKMPTYRADFRQWASVIGNCQFLFAAESPSRASSTLKKLGTQQ